MLDVLADLVGTATAACEVLLLLLFIDDNIIVYGNDNKSISSLEIWSKYLTD